MNESNFTIESNATVFNVPTYKLVQADIAWVLISTCLVFLMIPGLGFYYAGLVRPKHQLSLLMSSGLSIAIISLQWFLFGYSLVFSATGSPIIGNLDNAVLLNVGNEPNPLAPTIPANLYMIYQGMFAAITPCIAFGSVAERATLSSFLIFLFIWSTFVYDFIAYWTWGNFGWLRVMGALDFAGGAPVHMASGVSALAYALAIGPRKNVDFKNIRPSNLANIYIGTGLLWFGWFGFNGGSEVACNSRSVNAVVVTNLAACTGAVTWIFLEMIENKTKKMSLNGFCCGAIVGLVCITPASGYVQPCSSLVFGFVGAICCFFACKLKIMSNYKIDDACDVFAIHGIGGVVGNILTAFFAQNSVAIIAGDGSIGGGFMDKNYIQLYYQFLAVISSCLWAFVVTFILVKLIGLIPFIKLRLDEYEEENGSDWVELGEVAVYQREFEKINAISAIHRESFQAAASFKRKNAIEPIEVNKF